MAEPTTTLPRRLARAAGSLAAADWCRLGEAWVRLLWLRLRPRLPEEVRRSAPAPHGPPGPEDVDPVGVAIRRAERVVRYAAALHPGPVRCLTRSLVLRRLLRARRVPAVLKIGVRKDGAELAAHAWLEVRGVPVGEPEDLEGEFATLTPGGGPA
jgi:hypothetical protein